MMRLEGSTACTVLAAVLWAAPAGARQEPPATAAGSLEAALQVAEERGYGPEELEEQASELARLPDATEALLATWGRDGLSPAQTSLCQLTARSIDRREVVYGVSSGLAEPTDAAWQLAALRLLELHATSSEFELLGELVARAGVDDDDVLDAFVAAVVGVLQRDRRAFGELHLLMDASLSVRSGVVRAVGSTQDRAGLAWLGRQLKEPELTSIALQEIGRLAPASAGNEQGLRRRVRGFLHSKDTGLRRQAMRAVVGLRDTGAVGDLIEISSLLQGSEQRMAFSTLRALTGHRLPDRTGAWRVWHEDEQSWMRDEAPATLERLGSQQDAEVIAAIRALSRRGLDRDPLAVAMARLLHEHPSATVRGQVCRGLQGLGSTAVLRDLVRALDDEDPTVRACAHAALRSLTGRSLPPDQEAWRDELLP